MTDLRPETKATPDNPDDGKIEWFVLITVTWKTPDNYQGTGTQDYIYRIAPGEATDKDLFKAVYHQFQRDRNVNWAVSPPVVMFYRAVPNELAFDSSPRD